MTNVLIAGATGMLGGRIAHHLNEQPLVRDDGELRLLVRPAALEDPAKQVAVDALVAGGAVVVDGDLTNPESLIAATKGIDVVVSAVQGGKEVVVDGQVALARAAERNGVRRFIASDFAIDLFHAPAGAPMFASRRQADDIIDELDLEVQHVLTGGFLDMMLNPTNPSLVNPDSSTVTFWGEGTEPFDMTTVEDTARLTARLAVDDTVTGGVFTFSGTQTSMQQIADELERATGRPFARRSQGSLAQLRTQIGREEDPWVAFGLWYQLALATTPPFAAPGNDRYPDIELTSLRDHLRSTY